MIASLESWILRGSLTTAWLFGSTRCAPALNRSLLDTARVSYSSSSRQAIPGRNNKKWTQEDHDILSQRLAQDVPTRVIADELDRTIASVQKKVYLSKKRQGKPPVAPVPWLEADVKKMIALKNSGKSLSEISEEFPNRSPQSIRRSYDRCNRGLPRSPRKRWTEDEITRLNSLRKANVPLLEICQRLQRSLDSVTSKASYYEGKSEGQTKRWTAAEDEVLLRERRIKKYRYCMRTAALLPGRTAHAVHVRWDQHLRIETERSRREENMAGTVAAV